MFYLCSRAEPARKIRMFLWQLVYEVLVEQWNESGQGDKVNLLDLVLNTGLAHWLSIVLISKFTHTNRCYTK